MSIDNSRVLLVEGKDDEHVVRNLCQVHDVAVNWKIEPAKGPDSEEGVVYLLDQISIRLKESGTTRLGVLVDADDNAQSRWESLRDRLRKAGYSKVPENPDPNGTIVDLSDDFGPKFLGVWIMPNNKLSGMLEDFLTFLVPEGDKMLPRVDQFLKEILSEERKFTDTHLPKARIHSYLAVQKKPGEPLGRAITHHYLDAKKEVVEPFLHWLQGVFP